MLPVVYCKKPHVKANSVLLPLFERDSAPSWTQIELYDLDEEVKSNLIYKWNPKSIISKTKNPLTIHLIKSWHEVHKII